MKLSWVHFCIFEEGEPLVTVLLLWDIMASILRIKRPNWIITVCVNVYSLYFIPWMVLFAKWWCCLWMCIHVALDLYFVLYPFIYLYCLCLLFHFVWLDEQKYVVTPSLSNHALNLGMQNFCKSQGVCNCQYSWELFWEKISFDSILCSWDNSQQRHETTGILWCGGHRAVRLYQSYVCVGDHTSHYSFLSYGLPQIVTGNQFFPWCNGLASTWNPWCLIICCPCFESYPVALRF